MSKITLTINDKQIESSQGSTVLEAAKEAGMYIPTLCHHQFLAPFGGCRLCVVEIDRVRGFPTACTTPANDGMVVKTDSKQLQEFRRGVLELILTETRHVCLICPADGRCELQTVSNYVGGEGDNLTPYFQRTAGVCRRPLL